MNQENLLDNDLAHSGFGVYNQFHHQKDAEQLIKLLQSHHIPHEVEAPKQLMDKVMGGDPHAPKVFVKIRLADFQKVNALVEADMMQLIQEGKINLKKHFLKDFSKEELLDVLRKPDEWNFDTTVIAKYLLQTKGVDLSEAQIKNLQEERIQEIRKPRKGSREWMVVLFLLGSLGFLLFFLWYVGYLVNLVICFGMGYYYWKDVTTDPKGGKFYTFDRQTRNWGKSICILTAASNLIFLAVVLWRLS